MKLDGEGEKEDKSDEEESDASATDDSDEDSDEDSDSDDSDMAPRLKPVFVRKSDRVTIQDKEAAAAAEREAEVERQRLRLEAKKQTRKIIEEEVIKDKKNEAAGVETDETNITCDFRTDEENDETDYEAWKLRELRRVKRDRDERDAYVFGLLTNCMDLSCFNCLLGALNGVEG